MAKSKMNVKYKTKKREKNKKVVDKKEENIKNLKSVVYIILFIFAVYLGLLGLEKLGVFEQGYVKPSTNVEISDENILIGEVFNRHESEYLVLFDDFSKNKYDSYIKLLSTKVSDKVYYVDMSNEFNSKYKSEEANNNATNASELQINDITLIKIEDGQMTEYITGSDNIEEYLK